MCSCRTYVPVFAALVIPGFDLRATLRSRPGLAIAPAALAPLPGKEALLGSVTAAAAVNGVRPGMRLGEALATCPQLQLVEQDPATVEQAWEEVLRRLEDAGFADPPALLAQLTRVRNSARYRQLPPTSRRRFDRGLQQPELEPLQPGRPRRRAGKSRPGRPKVRCGLRRPRRGR